MNINTNVRPFSELDSYVSKISGHHSPSVESLPNYFRIKTTISDDVSHNPPCEVKCIT